MQMGFVWISSSHSSGKGIRYVSTNILHLSNTNHRKAVFTIIDISIFLLTSILVVFLSKMKLLLKSRELFIHNATRLE